MKELTVTSTAFQPNQTIPEKYTCDGPNPPLTIEGIPEDAKSLALVLDDPDAHGIFDHWIVWNISPTQKEISENSVPGIVGLNSDRQNTYTGPCPPPGKPHHYTFKVYAVDTQLELSSDSGKEELEKALKGHVIAEGKLVGLYGR